MTIKEGCIHETDLRPPAFSDLCPCFTGNVLGTIFDHWIYRNIAFFLCGLIWIFHPVMAGPMHPTKKQLWIIRILGGGILILISLFTRSYIY